MKELFRALTGSKLHKLDTPASDFDWKVITICPLREIISPFQKQKGKEMIGETEDECSYELVHFAKLWASCNPTILEILWSNKIQYKTSDGYLVNDLLKGRKNLLHKDKIFSAHRGYATAQRKKMNLELPNQNRSAKAIIAYIRIMRQGIDLLTIGDFNPVVAYQRDMLMEIKTSFDPKKHTSLAYEEITRLELEMQSAFDNCKLEYKYDIPWLEERLEEIYLKSN